MTRRWTSAVAVALLIGVASCGPAPREAEFVARSDTFLFTITSEPIPPFAREPTLYKVIVRDKETRQPIEGGEGQIFATSQDGANTWDALLPGPELGSYYGTLRYVTSGTWAVAIRFRRDSTQALQRVDWTQDVLTARDEPV